jgi:hypothetical protein
MITQCKTGRRSKGEMLIIGLLWVENNLHIMLSIEERAVFELLDPGFNLSCQSGSE